MFVQVNALDFVSIYLAHRSSTSEPWSELESVSNLIVFNSATIANPVLLPDYRTLIYIRHDAFALRPMFVTQRTTTKPGDLDFRQQGLPIRTDAIDADGDYSMSCDGRHLLYMQTTYDTTTSTPAR